MAFRDTHRQPAIARYPGPLPADRIAIDGPGTLLFPAPRALMKRGGLGRDPKGNGWTTVANLLPPGQHSEPRRALILPLVVLGRQGDTMSPTSMFRRGPPRLSRGPMPPHPTAWAHPRSAQHSLPSLLRPPRALCARENQPSGQCLSCNRERGLPF